MNGYCGCCAPGGKAFLDRKYSLPVIVSGGENNNGTGYFEEFLQDIKFNETTKIAEDLEVIYEVIKKSRKANINTFKYLLSISFCILAS